MRQAGRKHCASLQEGPHRWVGAWTPAPRGMSMDEQTSYVLLAESLSRYVGQDINMKSCKHFTTPHDVISNPIPLRSTTSYITLHDHTFLRMALHVMLHCTPSIALHPIALHAITARYFALLCIACTTHTLHPLHTLHTFVIRYDYVHYMHCILLKLKTDSERSDTIQVADFLA